MLKVRIIPVLTFNGFALVKTKNFKQPRMLGNPVQSARVFNDRMVDELVFLDIFASKQNRKINLKLVSDVLKECFMPVSVGGGIESIEDINDLLKIGADKVVIKTKALLDKNFIKKAVSFFGSQCISIAVDVVAKDDGYIIYCENKIEIPLENFINDMILCDVGEFVVNSVDRDGMMTGFDINLITKVTGLTNIPIIAVGGAGIMNHFKELFEQTNIKAVGASSIFNFTQYTPMDIKNEINNLGIAVRI